MRNSRLINSTTAFATVLAVISASAHGARIVDASDQAPSMVVRVSDLDVSQPADLKRLYQRVQEAANAVCASEIRRHRIETRRPAFGWRQRCVSAAIDGAIRDFGDPRLASLRDQDGDKTKGLL